MQAIVAIARQADGVPEFLQAVEQLIACFGFVFGYEDVHGNRPGSRVSNIEPEAGYRGETLAPV